MKPYVKVTLLCLSMVIMVAGCGPTPEAEANTQEPVTPETAAPIDQTETSVAPEDTPAPTLTAVQELRVETGATYYYVDGTTLVAVPSGEFQMGAEGSDTPQHTVNLDDYWIYSTEVTNQQYARCEAAGDCTSPDAADNPQYGDIEQANSPVVGVTYEQAVAYCSFVNGRLPTEAEWEKAALPADGGAYPWGDAEPSCELGNFNNCTDGAANVIQYQSGKSEYGSLGMAGNVFEWVSDWYAADYYSVSPADNPAGPPDGTSRSVRSSSFASTADQISVASRSSEAPQNHRADLGFRCVIENPAYYATSCQSPVVHGAELRSVSPPADSCPVLEIKQAPYCAGKLPLTNVKFVGPADATIDSKNCIPSHRADLFTCQTRGTSVSITADCQVEAPADLVCPQGFSLENNTCVADGGSGECFAGTYDAASQCCVDSESTAISNVCPVGTYYSSSQDACLTHPVKEVVSVVADILFASCAPTPNSGAGGNNGQSCQLPAGTSCPFEYSWDTARCCCELDWDSSVCVNP